MTLAGLSTLELRIPAAALRIWVDGPAPLAARVDGLAAAGPGVAKVRAGLWLVLPSAGRAGVFDGAIELAGRLLETLATEIGPGKARALVLPALAALQAGTPRLIDDPLITELVARPPRLAADAVHLTTHAALALEGRWATAPAGQLDSRTGRVVPIVLLGPPAPGLPPWRNPSVLTRTPRWVPRERPSAELASLLTGPAARLVGPLGVGKTRLAWEVLRGAGRAAIWRTTDVEPPRSTLLEALAAERQRPLWLVYDGLEVGSTETWAEIATLLERPDLGRGVHLLLIRRPGAGWPGRTAELPELELGPLGGDEWERLSTQLFHGLALPPTVAERLVEGAAGNPFALEESLVHLVRDRQLRQVFGSFFFSGREADAQFLPSARFRLHAEAEASRCGDPTPLRLLALVDGAVPSTEVRAAANALGASGVGPDWAESFGAAGLVESALGPWGEGVRAAIPAVVRALAEALSEESTRKARHALGELLAARSAAADELWQAWPLLAGTDEGARTALAATRTRGGAPRDEQFAALRSELAALAERGGDRSLEIDLLWALLPLARRLGRLHELEGAIARGLALAEGNAERFVAIAAVAAELAQKEGRLREAETVLRRALGATKSLDERRKELLVLELGRVLVQLGRKAEAHDLFEKTRVIAERAGRTSIAAQCLFLLGNLAFHDLDFPTARALHERALELRRGGRQGASASASLAALGAVALAEGNFPAAIARYEEARAALGDDSAELDEAFALLGLGRALARLGDAAGALPVLRRSLALREGRDDPRGEAIARVAVAEALLRLGQLEAAQAEVRKAHFALAMLPEGEARAEAERVLGEIQMRQRRPAEASGHLAEAERLYRASGNDLALPEVLAARLEAAVAQGSAELIGAAAKALADERQRRPEISPGAIGDFQLFRAGEWLRGKGLSKEDPLPHLERAYAELMRETAFLAPEHRQRFLFQVPTHQAIVDAATRRGLGMPA